MSAGRRRSELSIVIPMFDEAEVLGDSLASLGSAIDLRRCELVLVDDGSRDATHAVACSIVAELPAARVLRHDRNRGKGAAVRTGVLATTRPYVAFMDADMSTSLDDLDRFLDDLDRVDIVIGSRAVAGAAVRGSSALRVTMGRSFNVLMRRVVGIPVMDSQCGFKLFRGEVARTLFGLTECDRYAFDPEVLRLARLLGYTMLERPVDWTAGSRSAVRPVRDSARTGADLLRVRWSTRRSRLERRLVAPIPPAPGRAMTIDAAAPMVRPAVADVDALIPPITGAETSPT